ncbi:MAG: hypothetical protein EXS00_05495 [Phycisphaerales bacterium]|nr:hypothetical protein [Phycisphaerales bacterium]
MKLATILTVLTLCSAAHAGGEGAANELFGMSTAPAPPVTEADFLSSFEQFNNQWFVFSLTLGLLLSVVCSFIMAMHPTRTGRIDPIGDIENRKTLVLLGMVGAVVAELVRVQPVLAFVVFGIGGLIRFRTVLSDPRLTAKAVFVVVVGLACGTQAYAMAVFVTIFGWMLCAWLGRRMGARFKLRVPSGIDPHDVMPAALEFLRRNHWRVASSSVVAEKRQILILAEISSNVDMSGVIRSMQACLPRAAGLIEVTVTTE